jgi:hypothetical protein
MEIIKSISLKIVVVWHLFSAYSLIVRVVAIWEKISVIVADSYFKEINRFFRKGILPLLEFL